MYYPNIERHGDKDGVAGSGHQLHMDASHSLLADCNLFQGNETSNDGCASPRRLDIEFSFPTVHALVFTLGSTYVEIDLTYPAGGSNRRIVFSGELGAAHAPPESPKRADTSCLKAPTETARTRTIKGSRQSLEAVIEHALQDQGSVLIPAFSIGRTQELLYELEDITHSKLQAPTHQSPLHADEREQPIKMDSHVNHLTQTACPAIVITGNGIVHEGASSIPQTMLHGPRHDILFVGYQAQGTPRHVIQHHGPKGGYVYLDGGRFDIRAKKTD